MSAITVDTTDQKYLISIDRSLMDKPTFRVFFERLRTETLAEKINEMGSTDEADLMALSEEIKANWWAANESEILNRIGNYTPPTQ